MSHFFVITMVPDSTKEKNITDVVGALLAPYSEQLDVVPYKKYIKESQTKYYDSDDGLGQDEQGWYYMSTANLQAKWDWWEIGGRWNGAIFGKQIDSDVSLLEDNMLNVAHIDHKITAHAIVTPDGVWHEQGEMGWFGISHNDKEDSDWDNEVLKIIQSHRNCILVGIDCHI